MIVQNLYKKLYEVKSLKAIRSGLVITIPVLLLGSFSLVVTSFPFDVYQDFIQNFLNGSLYKLFNNIYNSTFGFLSIFLVFNISFDYSSYENKRISFIEPITSLVCFLIFHGFTPSRPDLSFMGPSSVFSAIYIAVIVSMFLDFIKKRGNIEFTLFAEGNTILFTDIIKTLIPAFFIIFAFSVLETMLFSYFGVLSIHNFLNEIFFQKVAQISSEFLIGLLFVFLTSFLWFFGIHGNNSLSLIADNIFVPAIDINNSLVSSGLAPTEIVTKPFLDSFVFIGGSGTCFAFLIALFIFSKRKYNRQLAAFSSISVLFNINEILLFGVPIVLNISFFLPFILTPVCNYIVSYIATLLGFVPYTTETVTWTTPIFLSGFLTTQSIKGVILQVVNLAIGIALYAPAIRRMDAIAEVENKNYLKKLIDKLNEVQENNSDIQLLRLFGPLGSLSRALASDIKKIFKTNSFELYYQPQFDNKALIGVETLLRWKHPTLGMIYPPLIIKLAEEEDILVFAERAIIEKSFADYADLKRISDENFKLSINITVKTLLSGDFENFIKKLIKKYAIPQKAICLEITEHMSVLSSDEIKQRIEAIKKLGILFSIDDFSMGHTNLLYLQNNHFDYVKLDGSLIRNIQENDNSVEIISSIVHLSKSLCFSIVAEYVETDKQLEILKNIGCHYFQGYLYSPALPLQALLDKYEKLS